MDIGVGYRGSARPEQLCRRTRQKAVLEAANRRFVAVSAAIIDVALQQSPRYFSAY
jgi:hypothetical protein